MLIVEDTGDGLRAGLKKGNFLVFFSQRIRIFATIRARRKICLTRVGSEPTTFGMLA